MDEGDCRRINDLVHDFGRHTLSNSEAADVVVQRVAPLRDTLTDHLDRFRNFLLPGLGLLRLMGFNELVHFLLEEANIICCLLDLSAEGLEVFRRKLTTGGEQVDVLIGLKAFHSLLMELVQHQSIALCFCLEVLTVLSNFLRLAGERSLLTSKTFEFLDGYPLGLAIDNELDNCIIGSNRSSFLFVGVRTIGVLFGTLVVGLGFFLVFTTFGVLRVLWGGVFLFIGY